MKNHILVGTHHKTGSVWMLKVFRNIASRLKVPFINLSAHSKYYRENIGSQEGVNALLAEVGRSSEYTIFFDDHSCFGNIDDDLADRFRGVRMVRSPVSVISSAAKYHCWSKEKWLHSPRKGVNGIPYQEYIKSLPDDNARYRFEMKMSAMNVITAMAEFDREPYFLTVKYEDVINDRSLVKFAGIMAHLGLEGREVLEALEAVYVNSLFGELSSEDQSHVQSDSNTKYGSDWDEDTWNLYNQKVRPLAEKLGYV